VGAAVAATFEVSAFAFGVSAFANIVRLKAAKPSSIPEFILVCMAILPLMFIFGSSPLRS
jgi:hypothetical protein